MGFGTDNDRTGDGRKMVIPREQKKDNGQFFNFTFYSSFFSFFLLTLKVAVNSKDTLWILYET